MEHENEYNNRNESVFSRKIRAGRRRTYFFDVKTTRANDYYLVITESKKRFDGRGYERHKIFLYKEDFNKFIEETTATIDFIKEKMPEFDFDSFSHKYDEPYENREDDTQKESDNNSEADKKDQPENEDDHALDHSADEMLSGPEDEAPKHEDDDSLKM